MKDINNNPIEEGSYIIAIAKTDNPLRSRSTADIDQMVHGIVTKVTEPYTRTRLGRDETVQQVSFNWVSPRRKVEKGRTTVYSRVLVIDGSVIPQETKEKLDASV